MSTDTAPGPGPGAPSEVGPGADSWLLEQRGSFVVGRCDGCGYTTSARRARFSVESDMQAHASGCGGRQDPGATVQPAAPTAHAPEGLR